MWNLHVRDALMWNVIRQAVLRCDSQMDSDSDSGGLPLPVIDGLSIEEPSIRPLFVAKRTKPLRAT